MLLIIYCFLNDNNYNKHRVCVEFIVNVSYFNTLRGLFQIPVDLEQMQKRY